MIEISRMRSGKDTTASKGVTYSYYVNAVNAVGTGSASNEAIAVGR
jgi:hypothetical protein